MVYILAAIVMFAFGWFWWRGNSYGALIMTLPMGLLGLVVGTLLTDKIDPARIVTAFIGGFLAWGPYLLKVRRLAPAGSAWRGQTMEQARARAADMDQWMRKNPGSWSDAPAAVSTHR